VDFSGETTFWPLGGAAPQIFIHVRDWPSPDSAHPNWDGGLPKSFDRENLKFGLKFSVLATIISWIVGVSSQNIFHTTCREEGVKHGYNFWKAGPLKFGRAKKRPKFCAIFDNFRFWSWISLELLQISKIGKKCDRQRFLPRSGKKSPVNFGPQSKKFYWLRLNHLSGCFGEDYISALRGCCPLKFSYALEIDQALLVHTQMGDGVPPKLLIVKI